MSSLPIENEAVEHVLAKCPMSWKLRVDLFDSHFTTVADILERYEISRYVKFMIRIQARQNIGNEKDQREPWGPGKHQDPHH